jgi:hypothetical protein
VYRAYLLFYLIGKVDAFYVVEVTTLLFVSSVPKEVTGCVNTTGLLCFLYLILHNVVVLTSIDIATNSKYDFPIFTQWVDSFLSNVFAIKGHRWRLRME